MDALFDPTLDLDPWGPDRMTFDDETTAFVARQYARREREAAEDEALFARIAARDAQASIDLPLAA